MNLSKQLQISEQLKMMKHRLIEIEKKVTYTMDNIDNLYREVNNIEKMIDLSTLGRFGSISFGTITHGDNDVYIYYGGNVGNTDAHVNKCLKYFGWPSLDELRKLSSFNEDGIPSEMYRADFSIDEYGEVFKERGKYDEPQTMNNQPNKKRH